MVAMQSSLIVSLGMVGALSIVRFRTAVKSPLDLLFLFWSISIGIISGVGLHLLAIATCLIMTLLLYGIERIPTNRKSELLVIRCSDISTEYEQIINKHTKWFKYSSKSVQKNGAELIYELSSTDSSALLNDINNIPETIYANLVIHSGEIRE